MYILKNPRREKMKKISYLVLILVVVLSFSVESVAGVYIAQKVDKITVSEGKLSLHFGKKTVEYVLPAKAGIYTHSTNDVTIFIQKKGEDCYPYHIVNFDMYNKLEKILEFSLAPTRADSGWCTKAQ